VIFYEDLPYAHRITEEQIIEHISKLEKELGVKLESKINGMQESTINKEHAISVYKSQLTEEISAEILGRMNSVGGERIWGEADVMQQI
jgi:hypothetical protein